MSNPRVTLEWKSKYQTTTGTTITQVNAAIDLNLKDDEIAEIHQIDSQISHGPVVDAADDALDIYTALSMDPDFDEATLAGTETEDLEVFFNHFYSENVQVGAAGLGMLQEGSTKVQYFDPPIKVGTNVGADLVKGGSTQSLAAYWHVRLYFTRRKASKDEMIQTLLKRR
jgi:hypothetical protein